jgi:phage shock protein A
MAEKIATLNEFIQDQKEAIQEMQELGTSSETIKESIARARNTINELKQQVRWEQAKFVRAQREIHRCAINVQTPQISRPRSPALNTSERVEAFQEPKQAVEPTLPVRELPEPPVLPHTPCRSAGYSIAPS